MLISPVFQGPDLCLERMSLAWVVTTWSTQQVLRVGRISAAHCVPLGKITCSESGKQGKLRGATAVLLQVCYSKVVQKRVLWLSSGGCLLPTFLFWEVTHVLGKDSPWRKGWPGKIAQCLGRGRGKMERRGRDAFGRGDLSRKR